MIEALAAGAQPLRVQAFGALVVVGEDGIPQGTMAEGLGVAQNTASLHLKKLAHAGLVSRARASRRIIHRAN